MKVFISASVALLAVFGCAWAAPSVQDNRIESDSSSSWALAARYLGTCLDNDDMTTCLAVKGITALNRAARSNNIELVNGISFKRDTTASTARNAKALTENDIYAQLPQTAEERSGRLIDMAMESAADFLGTHNLEVKIPSETTQEVARALDEGRGKLKKMMGPLALAVGAKIFALVPVLLGGLALLVFKAVFVAKIALVLALLVGGSRIFGGLGNKFGGALGGGFSNSGWTTGNTGGWSSGVSSGYPYARSMQADTQQGQDAQDLAYAGQISAQ